MIEGYRRASAALAPAGLRGAVPLRERAGTIRRPVEHMPSAKAAHFSSKEELFAFLTRVLAEISDPRREITTAEGNEGEILPERSSLPRPTYKIG